MDLIMIIVILADQVIIDIIITIIPIMIINITTCAIVMEDIMKFQDNLNA